MPWVPGQSKFADVPRTDSTGVWQAPFGGYRVHADKIVFCGTYMRTFTRMTTMESANESARHAVNAILNHLAYSGENPQQPSISGDYCDIWDPEENELEDLRFFKRVDQLLYDAGKPSIADILKFDEIGDLLYPTPTDGQALMTALGATLGKDWAMGPMDMAGAVNNLMEVARKVSTEMGTGTGGLDSIWKLLSTLGAGTWGASASKTPR
jgi:hypothetical protein